MEMTKEVIEKGLELCKKCKVYNGLSDNPCYCDINGITCYERDIEHKNWIQTKERREELNRNTPKTDWGIANSYMNRR